MNDIFQPRVLSYSLRLLTDFTRPNKNSQHFGISSFRCMAVKVSNMVPNDTKNVKTTETFKNNIRKKWEPALQAMSRLQFLCRLH